MVTKKQIRRSMLIPAFLMLLISMTGCGKQVEGKADRDLDSTNRYKIACTIGMITDVVQRVAGEHASVEGIIGQGVDPHLYRPTRTDVATLLGADVVFYNGLMLEGKMADTLAKVAGKNKQVVAVTDLLDESFKLDPPEFKGHYDPHVWMDVKAWIQTVEAVAETLSAYDPAHATDYRDNASAYQEELDRLDAYVRQVISTIPEKQRVLITAHDAFNYFSRAYGIRVMGIQGISTESEAGLQDINRLVDFIVDNDVKAVFVETSVADKNVRALAEGASSRGRQVNIGGSLFSDAMGKPGTYEGTYVGMIDHNATTVTRALGGQAPVGGMQDRLTGHE